MTLEVEQQAESSTQGAKRMRYLQLNGVSCAPSLHGCIDPITSTLVYQAPVLGPFQGHLVSNLASLLPPRKLPSPQGVNEGREIGISPDGKWVIIFHPNIGQSGGLLGVYDASVLSASAHTGGNITAISSFNIPCSILAIHHNYPPRLFTATGRGPSLGPKPPATYDPSQGPSFTILCNDGLYLFHPFQTLGTIPLDSAGSVPLALTADNSQTGWRTQMLRCPLHTRFRAVMGGSMGEDTGLRARSGWMGAVAGSEAVWAAVQVESDLRVIRIEYGLDSLGRFTMTTIPLPAIKPSHLASNLSEEQEEPKLELQGVIFQSRLTASARVKDEDQSEQSLPIPEVLEGAKVVLVLNENSSSEQVSQRIRFQSLDVEKREVELAESFTDIASDGVEAVRSWDWSMVLRPESASRSPPGWTALALCPLPAIASILALLRTPNGIILSHVDLTHSSNDAANETWSGLRGEAISIRDELSSLDVGLIVSQGVERGEQGLVAIIHRQAGAILLAGPTLSTHTGDPQDKEARETANSIILAMKQDYGWSDVTRAAFRSLPIPERGEFGQKVLRFAYQAILDETELDELKSLFSLQGAIYDALDDRRRETAAELVRLLDASYLLSQCASRGANRKIVFDLDSVWPLISVADWVSGVLASMMRDIILEKGKYEWCEPNEPEDPPPTRVLYLLHPSIRALVLRLHTQVHAFINFVLSIDCPIPHTAGSGIIPGTAARDPRATVLAKENVRDVLGKEGVDLIEWGKAIQALKSDTEWEMTLGLTHIQVPGIVWGDVNTDALLQLSCEPLNGSLREIIFSLPTPSSLFRSTSDFSETQYDGITHEPLSHGRKALYSCVRCGWKTLALGDGGWVGMGKWGEWRQKYERLCVCGGAWTRQNKSSMDTD